MCGWGLAPVATRALVTSLPPLEVAGIRFTISAVAYLPLVALAVRSPGVRADLRALLIVGVAGITGYNLPATIGLRHVPAGTAGLLIATEPVWIAVIASAVRRRPPDRRVLAGLGLSAAGAIALVGDEAHTLPATVGARFLAGSGLILFGAFMWGVYTVALRPLTERHGALATSALTCVLGSLPMVALLPFVLPSGRPVGTREALLLLALAIGSTVGATILWTHGVGELGPERAGVFLNLVPVVSVLAAAAFLGERIGTATLAGGAAVLAGVTLASTAPAPERIAAATPVRGASPGCAAGRAAAGHPRPGPPPPP